MNKIKEFIKKNYISVIVLFVLLLFLTIMSILWIKKGTFGLLDDEVVTLDCNRDANNLGEATCDVTLYPNGDTFLSINANYDFTDNIEYVSFTNNNEDLLTLVNTAEGFVVTNTAGITQATVIGTFKVNLLQAEEANSNFSVGLKNVELCNEEETIIPVEVSPYNFSNIATLENITIVDGVVEESFDAENFIYTATVTEDTDSIEFVVTPTNDSAMISGVNLESLHYGDNHFTITVESESALYTNTYNITITRPYPFTTEAFTYSSEHNYIYVGTLSDENIISNLELLPDGEGLSYNINNNKLEIKQDEEVIRQIDILRFSLTNTIFEGKIYATNEMTVNTFLSNLHNEVDNLSFRLLDGDNTPFSITKIENNTYIANERGNQTITNEYTFEVIYVNNEETTTLETLHFAIGQGYKYVYFEGLTIDYMNGIIKRLQKEMTYSELSEKIDTNAEIKYYHAGETEEVTEGTVRTGDTLRLVFADHTTYDFKLSVIGMLNNDDVIDISDVTLLYRLYRGKIELDPEYEAAAEINYDLTVDISDVTLLYRYYRGKLDSLEYEYTEAGDE